MDISLGDPLGALGEPLETLGYPFAISEMFKCTGIVRALLLTPRAPQGARGTLGSLWKFVEMFADQRIHGGDLASDCDSRRDNTHITSVAGDFRGAQHVRGAKVRRCTCNISSTRNFVNALFLIPWNDVVFSHCFVLTCTDCVIPTCSCFAYMPACAYIRACTHTHACTCTYTGTRACTYAHACTRTHMYACTRTHTHTRMHARTHARTYICVRIHTHAYTHAHARTSLSFSLPLSSVLVPVPLVLLSPGCAPPSGLRSRLSVACALCSACGSACLLPSWPRTLLGCVCQCIRPLPCWSRSVCVCLSVCVYVCQCPCSWPCWPLQLLWLHSSSVLSRCLSCVCPSFSVSVCSQSCSKSCLFVSLPLPLAQDLARTSEVRRDDCNIPLFLSYSGTVGGKYNQGHRSYDHGPVREGTDVRVAVLSS